MNLNLRVSVSSPEGQFDASTTLLYSVDAHGTDPEEVARAVRWLIAEQLPRLLLTRKWEGKIVQNGWGSAHP